MVACYGNCQFLLYNCQFLLYNSEFLLYNSHLLLYNSQFILYNNSQFILDKALYDCQVYKPPGQARCGAIVHTC